MLQGCVKVFLLIGRIPQLSFSTCFFFSGRSSIGSDFVSFVGEGGVRVLQPFPPHLCSPIVLLHLNTVFLALEGYNFNTNDCRPDIEMEYSFSHFLYDGLASGLSFSYIMC